MVTVGGRKVSGLAQRRSRGVVQVHGTVLHRVDEPTMHRVLRAASMLPSRRGTPSAWHPVAGLGQVTGCSFDRLASALDDALRGGREVEEESPTGAELEAAEEIADRRYRASSWVLSL